MSGFAVQRRRSEPLRQDTQPQSGGKDAIVSAIKQHIDPAGTAGKVTDFYGRLSDMGERLKPIDRRLKTLDKHIKQSETYAKTRAAYAEYQKQKPKDKEHYYEAHRADIILHEAASRYLKEHLNGRTEIPLKKWRAERGKLTAEKSVLTRKYATLKEEVRDVETVRKYAEEVSRTIALSTKSRSDLGR